MEALTPVEGLVEHSVDDICFAGAFLNAGFRLGDFTDSLVIMNAVECLIELRAVSREALVESTNIVQVLK